MLQLCYLNVAFFWEIWMFQSTLCCWRFSSYFWWKIISIFQHIFDVANIKFRYCGCWVSILQTMFLDVADVWVQHFHYWCCMQHETMLRWEMFQTPSDSWSAMIRRLCRCPEVSIHDPDFSSGSGYCRKISCRAILYQYHYRRHYIYTHTHIYIHIYRIFIFYTLGME
jgi:hypothetical protein